MRAAASGASTSKIAAELYISVRTVESHLGSIYRKLGVSSRAELVAWTSRMSGATGAADHVMTAGTDSAAELAVPSLLVGREAELEPTTDASTGVADGSPRVLMVSGETGIGKSTLVPRALRSIPTPAATAARTAGAQGDSGRLFEREAAIAGIDAAIRAATDGSGRLLVLDGHAGLGKTTLARVALDGAEDAGVGVLTGRGRDLERGFPGGVIRQLFTPALAGMAPDERLKITGELPGTAAALLAAAGVEPQGEAAVFALLDGLFRLTDSLAAVRPRLVVVDDAHWADRLSLRYIAYLLDRIDELPVSLVVTARPGEGDHVSDLLDVLRGHEHATVERLAPLGLDSVTRLSRAAFGEQAGTEVCEAVAEATSGNPFFIGELLASLASEQGPGMHLRVRHSSPQTITRQVLVRIGRLGGEARQLAGALAVLGDDSELVHTAALADLEVDVAATLAARLATVDVFRLYEPLGFVHPLVAQAVYDDIPAVRRSSLHLRAARLLDARGVPIERVAAQLLRTRPQGDGWIADRLCAGSVALRSVGDHQTALTYLVRALEEPPSEAALPEVLAAVGEAEIRVGRSEGADHLEAALQLISEPRDRARMALRQGWAYLTFGRYDKAALVLRAGLAGLTPGDDLAFEIGAAYLNTAVYSPQMRATAIRETEPLTRKAIVGDNSASRHALAGQALLAAEGSSPTSVVMELCERAWSQGALLADTGPDGLTWRLPVWAALLVAEPAFAYRVGSAVVSAAREAHSPVGYINGTLWRAWAGYLLGHLDEIGADLDTVMEAARHGAWAESHGYAAALAVHVAIERGDHDAAARYLAMAAPPHEYETLEAAFLLSSRGLLRAAQGRLAEGLDDQLEAGRIFTDRFDANRSGVWWRTWGALLAHQLGEQQLAERLAAEDLELASEAGSGGLLGRALYTAGLIAPNGPDRPLLEAAVNALATSDLRLLLTDRASRPRCPAPAGRGLR